MLRFNLINRTVIKTFNFFVWLYDFECYRYGNTRASCHFVFVFHSILVDSYICVFYLLFNCRILFECITVYPIDLLLIIVFWICFIFKHLLRKSGMFKRIQASHLSLNSSKNFDVKNLPLNSLKTVTCIQKDLNTSNPVYCRGTWTKK